MNKVIRIGLICAVLAVLLMGILSACIATPSQETASQETAAVDQEKVSAHKTETVILEDKSSFYTSNVHYRIREPLFMWYVEQYREPVDVVFLGDSITDYFEWQEVFPNLTVVNRGIGSDTTDGALARLDSVIPLSPKVVSCLLGINDLTLERPQEEIIASYSQIMDELHDALPNTTIIVNSVLPVTEANGVAPESILALNQAIETVCADREYVVYLNIFDKLADEAGYLKAEYDEDSVHLSVEGYLQWLDVLLPEIDHCIAEVSGE